MDMPKKPWDEENMACHLYQKEGKSREGKVRPITEKREKETVERKNIF